MSKFDRESPKVNQVIFFSAPTSIPNMKALAQIRFEISCTQDFQNLFSKGHNTYMKKLQANYFFHEESVYEISKPYHSPKGLKFHQKFVTAQIDATFHEGRGKWRTVS